MAARGKSRGGGVCVTATSDRSLVDSTRPLRLKTFTALPLHCRYLFTSIFHQFQTLCLVKPCVLWLLNAPLSLTTVHFGFKQSLLCVPRHRIDSSPTHDLPLLGCASTPSLRLRPQACHHKSLRVFIFGLPPFAPFLSGNARSEILPGRRGGHWHIGAASLHINLGGIPFGQSSFSTSTLALVTSLNHLALSEVARDPSAATDGITPSVCEELLTVSLVTN